MEKFAGYGFNKSHAAAYALLAYQTAYLKAHHPAAFMAANLSAVMDDTDKVRQFYDDASRSGLDILPPDVNASELPLRAGRRQAASATAWAPSRAPARPPSRRSSARAAKAAVHDLFDFCRRVDKRSRQPPRDRGADPGGAFDAIEPNRAHAARLGRRRARPAEQASAPRSRSSLFGDSRGANDAPALVPARAWPELERAAAEKTALGFYFSGHPYNSYRQELSGLIQQPLSKLVAEREGVLLAGLVTAMRTQITRRGKMASSRSTTARRRSKCRCSTSSTKRTGICCGRTGCWLPK